MKKIAIILVSLAFCRLAFGQAPLSLYYLENIPQSNLLNPAKAPRCNGYFGVPAINGVYTSFQTNISVPVFFQKEGNQWISFLNSGYDYTNLYKQLGKSANIQFSQSLSFINLGWRINQGYITIAINQQNDASLKLPIGLFVAADKGLPDGTFLDLSELGINAKFYREISIGFQHDYSKEFSYGLHGKLLFGSAAFKSDVSSLSIKHLPEGWWQLDVNADFYSSFPLEITTKENNVPDTIRIPELSQREMIDKSVLNFNNPGIAFDLGAEYKMNESWRFSGSVNDLGLIMWTSDLNSFHSSGSCVIKGVELDGQRLNKDSISAAIDDLVDSIKTVVKFDSRNDGFTTTLTPKMYLGAQFTPNHYFSLGFLSKSTFRKNAFHEEFNLSANLNLYRGFTTTLNYTVSTKGAYYFGFGLSQRGSFIQAYTMLDYIPTRYRYYQVEDSHRIPGPFDFQDFNLMVGVNIIIGGNGFRDKPMIDSYSEF